MKHVLLATVLVLSCTQVFAKGMADFAYSPTVGDTSIKISMMGFKERHWAREFCRSLGMKLASPSTIEAITVTTAPQTDKRIHNAIYFKVQNDDKVLKGIWGWLSAEESPEKNLDIFMKFDGESQKSADNFADINNILLSNGYTPYKLPAICEKK
ncbi:hypothetical protein D3C87_1326020 [compost metagenome]